MALKKAPERFTEVQIVDPATRRVRPAGREIPFTAREVALLEPAQITAFAAGTIVAGRREARKAVSSSATATAQTSAQTAMTRGADARYPPSRRRFASSWCLHSQPGC